MVAELSTMDPESIQTAMNDKAVKEFKSKNHIQ